MIQASPVFCFYCGIPIGNKTATRDHVQPLSRGGSRHGKNLVWCCNQCNTDKGCLSLEEYRVVIAFRKGHVWTNLSFPGEIQSRRKWKKWRRKNLPKP